jgi:hypothetical protein
MRGRESGHRCAVPCPPENSTGGLDQACIAVLTDIDAGFPVGPAELDALEAFLMPQILALLEEMPRSDSEAPQSSTRMETSENPRGGAREVFARETA